MKPVLLALGPVALLVSACAAPPPPARTGEGMIDPATQKLKPEFVDQSFSLADLYDTRLDRTLPNSDRRAIDAAMERALGAAPFEGPSLWSNPVGKTSGQVDLLRWELDRRFGALCGAFEHAAKVPGTLAGAFTICRASTDPAWKLDEAVWRDGGGAVARPARPRPPATTNPPAVTNPPNPPVASPPSRAGVRPPAYVPPPCPTGPGAGAQTLGDCLAAPN